MSDGRQIKILTVIDDYTREAVWIGVDYRINGMEAARMLAAAALASAAVIRQTTGRDNGFRIHWL